MSDEGRGDGLDAAIDAVARRMTAGDPGPGLRARTLARIDAGVEGRLRRARPAPAAPLASLARFTPLARFAPAAAAAVLLVAGGLMLWQLSGSPERGAAGGDTARANPPSVAAPGLRGGEPPPAAVTALRPGEAAAPPAAAVARVPVAPASATTPRAERAAASAKRSRGAGSTRPATRIGELAERMRREPGALELDPLPVAALPMPAGVRLDAVRLGDLTLTPLVVETLDEDETPEPRPSN